MIFNYLIPFDCPDAYGIIDNDVLILEHFRLDAVESFLQKSAKDSEKIETRIPGTSFFPGDRPMNRHALSDKVSP